MTDRASPLSGLDLTGAGPGLDPAAGPAGIDPEDPEVVPATLMSMVGSVRATYRAVRANPCYPAIVAVGAVEDTVAAVAGISSHLELYVGDYSGPGGKAVVRASDLLGQARSALSDARHHLALNDVAGLDLTPQEATAAVG